MTFFLILFIIGCLGLLSWIIYKMGELDDRQERLDKYSVHLDERANKLDDRKERLDKYSVHLDERANKLSAWEQELINWSKEVGK